MHHILYHSNCADGFAAACIARHALLLQGDQMLNLQPVNYGQPDQMPLGKDVVLFPGDSLTYLDYTPPQTVIDKIESVYVNTVNLTIIDHHSTAAPRHGQSANSPDRTDLPEPPKLAFKSVYDPTQSGAALAWHHFMDFKLDSLPRAVELIQWRDLGHAFDPALADDPRTPNSLNLHAYLFRCLPRTFDAWTTLLLDDTLHLDAVLTGMRFRAADRLIIKSAVDCCHWLNFNGHEIPAVNGLDAGLVSDACTALLRAYPTAPFAASWFIDARTGNATYSLRSRRESDHNVADIAAAMAPGGGGHPNAAGFSTPIPVPFV